MIEDAWTGRLVVTENEEEDYEKTAIVLMPWKIYNTTNKYILFDHNNLTIVTEEDLEKDYLKDDVDYSDESRFEYYLWLYRKGLFALITSAFEYITMDLYKNDIIEPAFQIIEYLNELEDLLKGRK